MTDISTTKDRLRAAITAGGYLDPYAADIETLLAALDELENSYVPHLPADTDTWLVDGDNDHPLPPNAAVKFHYGPGDRQYLTVQTIDHVLRIVAATGWITVTAAAPNIFHATGSVK